MAGASASITTHGTLVRIDGEGILLTGEAGSGKSTTALDLLLRGGSLVADDVVIVERTGDRLEGTAPEKLKGVISIPHLGIFDVREVIGNRYFIDSSQIDRCIEISPLWDNIDLKEQTEILGLSIPISGLILRDREESDPFLITIDRSTVRLSEKGILREHDARLSSCQ